MTDDQHDEQEPSRLREMMEQANARAAAAETQLAELNRRELFRDAGLDLTNRQHQAFVRAYDGELDPDQVRNYVTELGVTREAPAPQEPQVSAEEEAALTRMAEATREGSNPAPAPDRRAQLQEQLAQAARRGASIQEIDRLSEEFSRAGGFRTTTDAPS